MSTRIELSRCFSVSRRPTGPVAPGLSVARRPTAALMTSSGVLLASSASLWCIATGAAAGGATGSAEAAGAVATGGATGVPVTASNRLSQSGPSSVTDTGLATITGAAAGAGAAGAGAGAGASTTGGIRSTWVSPWPSSPARASRSLSIRLGSAGAGWVPCSRLSNMSRTAAVENRITSITSGVISSSPLRSLSKRFSVRWHRETSSVALRKPAPPLMV